MSKESDDITEEEHGDTLRIANRIIELDKAGARVRINQEVVHLQSKLPEGEKRRDYMMMFHVGSSSEGTSG